MNATLKTLTLAAGLIAAGFAAAGPAMAQLDGADDAFNALRAHIQQRADLDDLRQRSDIAKHGRRAQYNKFVLQNVGRPGMQAVQQSGEIARLRRAEHAGRVVAAGDRARDVRAAAKVSSAARAAKGARIAKAGLSATGVGALVVVAEEGVRATTGVDVVTPVIQTAGDLTVGTVKAVKEKRLLRHLGETAVNVPKRMIVDNVKSVHKTFTKKGQLKKNVKKWGCGWGNMFKRKAKKKAC
ncbi:MAG: hypothetical protein AAF899_18525 [Pseudomonadota bacterium]